MDMELTGKVAIITGGSVGIGLAVAEALAQEGVDLVIAARNEARVYEKAKSIEAAHGVRVCAVVADVATAQGTGAILQAAEKSFGGADILINNAGTGSNETIQEAPDDKWQYFWDLHTMAAVRLARGVIPLMKARGGGIILNNASICAKQPLGYEPIYNVTKAALMMFSKCLANEVVGDNIRVNCINPGLVLTPDWVNTATELTAGTEKTAEEHLKKVAQDNAPIGRFATPEELAKFFVFMCSPAASYCVGSTYYVDGGWLNSVA